MPPSTTTPAVLRIAGIDPGLNTTGYGILEINGVAAKLIEAGIVRSTRSQSLAYRCAEIHRGITEVLVSLEPRAVAIEELYSHYDRPKTAILMGHARGVICLAATLLDLPVYHYGSTRIKKLLTGNGRAPKVQMQESIRRELQLASIPEPHDVADALAVALCHSFSRQFIPPTSVGGLSSNKRHAAPSPRPKPPTQVGR